MGIFLLGASPPSGFNGGKSQLNVNFLQGGGEYPFLNSLKEAQAWGWGNGLSVTTALTPDLFDADGYWATANVTIPNGGLLTGNNFIPSATEYAGNRVIAWDGIGTLTVTGDGTITPVNGSLSNLGGGAGRYEFSFTGTKLNIGHTVNGSVRVTNIRSYNVNDETDLNNGKIFGKQFLKRVRDQGKFGVLRFLNWQAGNITNVSGWDTASRPTTYYQYNGSQYRADLLCNSAGSGITTNSGADYAVSAPSTWATSGGLPADKSTVHAVWSATSPTAATVTFAGGGSPNITWTAHGLTTGNQIFFTTTGALPSGITATTLGILPTIQYFVTKVDADTITVSATSGGAAINFATTGTGTTTGRTTVTLNVDGTGNIQVLSEYSSQMTTSGNSYPIGGAAKSLSTLVYDATLNAWIKQGGTLGPGGIQNGVPLSLCLELCKQVGAHPHFVSPPLACTPMSGTTLADSWHGQLATLCKNFAASYATWMIPRFEGPNETWNTFGGFFQTTYANAVGQIYGWGNNAFHDWYGKAISTIGQAINSVYGGSPKANNLYVVVCGVQTSSGTSVSTSNARLASTKYIGTTPQAGYSSTVGVAEAWRWASTVVCAHYLAPGSFGQCNEVAFAYNWYTGDATAKASATAAYMATLEGGGACTFTNGSKTVGCTNHGFSINQLVYYVAGNGTSPINFVTGNIFYVSATNFTSNSVELSATVGGASVTAGSAGTGTFALTPGINSVAYFLRLYQNWADWANGFSMSFLNSYEGAYGDGAQAFDSTNPVTSAITGATNTTNAVFTISTTNNQSIRAVNQQNALGNVATVAGMFLKLSGLTGTFASFNNQVVSVLSVSTDGTQITTDLDASGVGSFTGGGAFTYYLDSGATIPMSTALKGMRYDARFTPLLQNYTADFYNGAVAIVSGGVTGGFPSQYLLASTALWGVFITDVYASPDPPEWSAIVAFNA